MAKGTAAKREGDLQDLRWRAVWVGYAVALVATGAVGLPLLMMRDSTWSLAAVGSAGLFGGGIVTGRLARPQPALLNGALLAVVYNFTIAIAFFIGSFLQFLPEPLPGLPQGDSTFFFAWPLAQFALGILGAAVGHRTSAQKGVRN